MIVANLLGPGNANIDNAYDTQYQYNDGNGYQSVGEDFIVDSNGSLNLKRKIKNYKMISFSAQFLDATILDCCN